MKEMAQMAGTNGGISSAVVEELLKQYKIYD
jgi:hypothetical protein